MHIRRPDQREAAWLWVWPKAQFWFWTIDAGCLVPIAAAGRGRLDAATNASAANLRALIIGRREMKGQEGRIRCMHVCSRLLSAAGCGDAANPTKRSQMRAQGLGKVPRGTFPTSICNCKLPTDHGDLRRRYYSRTLLSL